MGRYRQWLKDTDVCVPTISTQAEWYWVNYMIARIRSLTGASEYGIKTSHTWPRRDTARGPALSLSYKPLIYAAECCSVWVVTGNSLTAFFSCSLCSPTTEFANEIVVCLLFICELCIHCCLWHWNLFAWTAKHRRHILCGRDVYIVLHCEFFTIITLYCY